jgi:hypothetical protein
LTEDALPELAELLEKFLVRQASARQTRLANAWQYAAPGAEYQYYSSRSVSLSWLSNGTKKPLSSGGFFTSEHEESRRQMGNAQLGNPDAPRRESRGRSGRFDRVAGQERLRWRVLAAGPAIWSPKPQQHLAPHTRSQREGEAGLAGGKIAGAEIRSVSWVAHDICAAFPYFACLTHGWIDGVVRYNPLSQMVVMHCWRVPSRCFGVDPGRCSTRPWWPEMRVPSRPSRRLQAHPPRQPGSRRCGAASVGWLEAPSRSRSGMSATRKVCFMKRESA